MIRELQGDGGSSLPFAETVVMPKLVLCYLGIARSLALVLK